MLLESTEGFPRLTAKQQQIIRTSLLLQARAERDMHPNHKNDPWYYDWLDRSPFRRPKFKQSLKHIEGWYCHAAIASLEIESLSGDRPPQILDKFFEAEYLKLESEYELERALRFFGFPAVVHVNSEQNNTAGESTQVHSFLALGYGPEQSIMVWEKNGFSFPYRVVNLEVVYEEYQSFRYWGLRKLR